MYAERRYKNKSLFVLKVELRFGFFYCKRNKLYLRVKRTKLVYLVLTSLIFYVKFLIRRNLCTKICYKKEQN